MTIQFFDTYGNEHPVSAMDAADIIDMLPPSFSVWVWGTPQGRWVVTRE